MTKVRLICLHFPPKGVGQLLTCGIKRCTQKLGHHLLRYVSKFRRSERDNFIFFLLANSHRENILKRTILVGNTSGPFQNELKDVPNDSDDGAHNRYKICRSRDIYLLLRDKVTSKVASATKYLRQYCDIDDAVCPVEWGEISTKQSVGKCKQINF